MTALSLQLDGRQLATINLAGMELVEITVRGALDANPKALLEAGGGNYSAGGCGDLIWIAGLALQPGQVLRVQLAEASGAGDPGKSLEELFPDGAICTATESAPGEHIAGTASTIPTQHEDFAVSVTTSQGQLVETVSDALNTHFTFTVLWDSMAGKARVSLDTHCVDDEIELTSGTRHLKAWLGMEDSVTFTLNR